MAFGTLTIETDPATPDCRRRSYAAGHRRPERPLTGYRIAVASASGADELSVLLRRYGATVCAAAPITVVDLSDNGLHRQTEELIADPPDILIATTAIGIRGWITAAEGWGLAGALVAALSGTEILSRGPKATGALRAAGLAERWSSRSESSAEIAAHLLGGHDLTGRRIAVQLPGTVAAADPVCALLDGLSAAGADLIRVGVYRWSAAAPGGELDRLIGQVVDGQCDAVSFTSAPAVAATLARARDLGVFERLVAALRTEVPAMCVGPMAAAPLDRLGVPTSVPHRKRLAALARHIADELPLRSARTVRAAGRRLEIRGGCVLVDGIVRQLPPTGLATLRALARNPGAVVGRDDLLRVLPGNANTAHAVETAVGRLRTSLGDKDIVATVVKRGYRLAIDDQHHPGWGSPPAG